jgi:hypothetical protein
MADPWERRDGESVKAYAAFRVFRDAGPHRSIASTAQEVAASTRTVERWSSQFDWATRAEAWDDTQWTAEDGARLDALREMHKLHSDVGKAIVRRALAALNNLPLDHIPAGAATRLLELGMRVQRQTLTTTPEEMLGTMRDDGHEEDPWEELARSLTSVPVPASPHPAA